MKRAKKLAAGLAVAASLKREAVGRTYRNDDLMRKAVEAKRKAQESVEVCDAER